MNVFRKLKTEIFIKCLKQHSEIILYLSNFRMVSRCQNDKGKIFLLQFQSQMFTCMKFIMFINNLGKLRG